MLSAVIEYRDFNSDKRIRVSHLEMTRPVSPLKTLNIEVLRKKERKKKERCVKMMVLKEYFILTHSLYRKLIACCLR